MQRVDLYLPQLRPRQEWLTAHSLTLVFVGMVLIFSLAGLVQRHSLNTFEQQVSVVEAQKLAADNRLAKIKAKINPANKNALDANLAKLRAQIAQRIAVRDFYQRQSLGNEAGYARRLQTLAKVTPRGIALSAFRFSRGDQFAEFMGKTRSASEIADFIELLKQDQSFANTAFGSVSIAAAKPGQPLNFAIGMDSVFDYQTASGGTK